MNEICNQQIIKHNYISMKCLPPENESCKYFVQKKINLRIVFYFCYF